MSHAEAPDGSDPVALAHWLFDRARAGEAERLGATVDRVNDRGQTPLAGAVFKGYADVAAVLVAAGADPDAGSPAGSSRQESPNSCHRYPSARAAA